MVQAPRDDNRVPGLIAASDVDGTDVVLEADAANDSLKVTIAADDVGIGGGVQYTEGDTDASITGNVIMFESNTGTNAISAVSNSAPLPVSDAGGILTVDGTVTANLSATDNAVLDNIDTSTAAAATSLAALDNSVDGNYLNVNVNIAGTDVVSGSGTATGALRVELPTNGTGVIATVGAVTTITNPVTVTATNLDVQSGGADLATSTQAGAIQTSVELIDDTVATLGTTTYSETTTKGLIIGAVRRDADTTMVDTTNEVGPVQMNAAGQLKVEVFSGETLPVSMTSTTITGTVAVTQSGTWDEVGINDSGNSITVDNGGTFVTQENGALLTAAQLIDDVVFVDDTATHSTGSTKGVGIMAAATPTDGSVNANDIGMVAMTTDRKLHVAIMDALPAGTAAIGKLAANSGVDIGDVDITSIAAGNNNIGDVDIASIAAGDNNIGNVDIVSGTVTTVTTLTGGGIAHDSADSGNPHKVGYIAYSPDGTTPGTAVAELDRTNAKADLDGRHLINDEHPRWWSYHEDSSSALTDASVQADPGDGFQIVITNIIVSTGAATALNFFLEEGASKIFGPVYLEAVAGRGFCTPAGFKKHVTASTAVTITTSAAIAHCVDIQGYIQAV